MNFIPITKAATLQSVAPHSKRFDRGFVSEPGASTILMVRGDRIL